MQRAISPNKEVDLEQMLKGLNIQHFIVSIIFEVEVAKSLKKAKIKFNPQ